MSVRAKRDLATAATNPLAARPALDEPAGVAAKPLAGARSVDPGLPDADLRLRPGFLTRRSADRFLSALLGEIRWSQHRVRLFGREHPSPRLSAWYGSPGAIYRYSGQTLEPLPWTTTLEALRDRVEQACGQVFDGVLLNLYRDGRDGMGWHSDDERELGPEPCIASVSLGAPRRFSLKHRERRDLPVHSFVLEHGSLLEMRGRTQRSWRHSVPKTRAAVGARVNLTFRPIVRLAADDPAHEETRT